MSTLRTQEQEGFNSAVGGALSTRFTLAQRAPIMQEQICSEIGLLGDGPAVQQMLDGDYSFPCDTDHYTILGY